MLRSVAWSLITEVSIQSIGRIFKGWAIHLLELQHHKIPTPSPPTFPKKRKFRMDRTHRYLYKAFYKLRILVIYKLSTFYCVGTCHWIMRSCIVVCVQKSVSGFVCEARDCVIELNVPVDLLSITHQLNRDKTCAAESDTSIASYLSIWLAACCEWFRASCFRRNHRAVFRICINLCYECCPIRGMLNLLCK
jgi:hypothetical protein